MSIEEIILKTWEYGSVGGVAIGLTFLWLKYGRTTKEPSEKRTHPPCPEVITIGALFDAHEKAQAEALAIVHNGLNSNAGAIKDISLSLQKNTIAIEKLTTIIDERIPKKP